MRAPSSLATALLAAVFLAAGLVLGACETSLDAIPADTVVVLELDVQGGGREGPAVGPQWANLFFRPADERACVALPEEARFSLNGQPAEWQELGGRGRDPFSAFSPGCPPPQASWSAVQAFAAPFVFLLEHDDVALRAELDADGTVTTCDFPACSTERAF